MVGRAWGPRQVALGAAVAVAAYIITFSLIGVAARAVDHELKIEDTPVFEAATELAKWGDERLRAATRGDALAAPPQFAGDVVTARIAYVLGIVNAILLTVAAWVGFGRWRRNAIDLLGLRHYDLDRLWRPAALTIGAYVIVLAYTVIVQAIDIDLLKPTNAMPGAVARDTWGLVIFGFVALVFAPISEETFFRGLVFGGFARFGFWPAAAISGLAFSLAHLDPGTLIPFTLIGMGFCWLFRSSGSLWENIISHMLFNATSFILLLASRT